MFFSPFRSVLSALLVVWSCELSSAAEPQRDHCVILVSVDGLAGFYFDDSRAHMPTLRKLAAEGARADGLLCSFPTVTWPNHTTMVTGVVPAKHGVIGNAYYDRAKGETVPFIPDPIFDKSEIVKVPTIYDLAHAAKLKTAGIVWPATRNARTLDFTVPDMGGEQAWPQFGTRPWLEELRAEGLPVDRHAAWVKEKTGGVQRDWLYSRMAENLILKHAPNLLLLHLVETDHVQHRTGPRTDDAYWSVSYADDRLRQIVDAIDNSSLKGKTTLFVCSDHGFCPVSKEIRPNVRLRQLGLVELGPGDKIANTPEKKRAICRPEGGSCAVYVMDDTKREAIVAELQSELAKLDGVEAVYGPDKFPSIGQPTVAQDARAADLWLTCRSGYTFGDSAVGEQTVVQKETTVGTHGYRPDQPELYGTCIVWGAGVKPGTKLGLVSNLDIAPTMAKLLGIEMPNVDGKPIVGIGD